MSYTKLLLAVALSMLPMSAFAERPNVIRLYDGPELPREQVASLLHPSDIAMVLVIDGRKAGFSCLTGCMFQRPVQILPGKHRFFSANMHMAPFPKGHVSNPVPLDSGAAHPLLLKRSLLAMSMKFDFEATVEAGKTYALSIGYVDSDGARSNYVWLKEMPNVPLE